MFLNGYAEYLHRIVAITYIPNPENKKEVNHKDLNKENCTTSNLEWTTPAENVLHAKNHCKRKTKTSSNSGILYLKTTPVGYFHSLQQAKSYCLKNYNCSLCTIGRLNANWKNNLIYVRNDEPAFDINEFWARREKEVLFLKKKQDFCNKTQKGTSGVLLIEGVPSRSFPSIRSVEKEYGISLKKTAKEIYSALKGKYVFIPQDNALVYKM